MFRYNGSEVLEMLSYNPYCVDQSCCYAWYEEAQVIMMFLFNIFETPHGTKHKPYTIAPIADSILRST